MEEKIRKLYIEGFLKKFREKFNIDLSNSVDELTGVEVEINLKITITRIDNNLYLDSDIPLENLDKKHPIIMNLQKLTNDSDIIKYYLNTINNYGTSIIKLPLIFCLVNETAFNDEGNNRIFLEDYLIEPDNLTFIKTILSQILDYGRFGKK